MVDCVRSLTLRGWNAGLRISALLCVVHALTFGQEVLISARTDSSSYRIGDWISYTLEAIVPRHVSLVPPQFADTLGSFDVLAIEQRDEPNATHRRSTWRLRVTTCDSGMAVIPPVSISYTEEGDTTLHTALSNAIVLNMTSVAVDLQSDIRDIAPPLTAPWLFEDFLPYLLFAIVTGALIGLLMWWRRRRSKKKALLPERVAVAPHIAALSALRDLEDARLWQNGKVKQYYSEITEIVRRFFEGRYGILALEMTSDEILNEIKHTEDSEPVMHRIKTFLTTADLVKFAKYEPTPSEHEYEMECAYAIVRAMIPTPLLPQSDSIREEAHVS
jgi:hypothetical protein